jgi:hypothetical protein
VKPTRQWAALLIFVAWGVGWARSQEVVCDRGEGHFEGSFRTGVTVRVGAVASGGFATRDCEAVLRWGNERVVAVQTAAQVDIDVLGVDMGLDVPVVALWCGRRRITGRRTMKSGRWRRSRGCCGR